MITPKDTELMNALNARFSNEEVIPEWPVTRDSHDDYNKKHIYSPRIDFAVGPFNLDADIDRNNEMINEHYRRHLALFNLLNEISQNVGRNIVPNANPRCFLAIEVENSGSRKHRLGSIVNAFLSFLRTILIKTLLKPDLFRVLDYSLWFCRINFDNLHFIP